MPQNYVPIFIFVAIVGALLPITLLLAKLVRPSNPSKTKLMPYECGIDPIDSARGRYTVRYYIIAILFVVFAERARIGGMNATDAATEGARSRMRPILITACAMIAGMVPMALGGDQTAPLGRAVIGGLAAGTLSTLFVLPAVFALLMGGSGTAAASLDPFDPQSKHYIEGASDAS